MAAARLLLALLAAGVGGAGAQLFWADEDRILRADYAGGQREALVTGLGDATGIEVATAAGLLLFTDAAAGSVFRCALDGSNVTLLASGFDEPSGLALDAASGAVFVSTTGTPGLWRTDLAGAAPEELAVGSLKWPAYLRAPGDGYVYFSDAGREWSSGQEAYIARVAADADAAAPAAEEVLTRSDFSSQFGTSIYGFAFSGSYLYFGSTRRANQASFDATVWRVDVDTDGSIEAVYDSVGSALFGLELDADAGLLWWTSFVDDHVWAAALDGSSAAMVEIYEGDGAPRGVVAFRREDRCGNVFCVQAPGM